MIHHSEIHHFIQSGERVMLTFYDGEGSLVTSNGKILGIIEEAILFRIRSGYEIDRTIVIYLHRIVNLKRAAESKQASSF